MKELLITNWRTSLLAVSILVGLLMFTQGKISASEFLAILAFFNVAGYLLARDAAAPVTGVPALVPSPRQYLLREVAYYVLGSVLLVLVALSFLPLVRDAVAPNHEFLRPDAYPVMPVPPTEPDPLPQQMPTDHD